MEYMLKVSRSPSTPHSDFFEQVQTWFEPQKTLRGKPVHVPL